MSKCKPLADGPVTLRNTASRNETVMQRKGNNVTPQGLSLIVCYSMSRSKKHQKCCNKYDMSQLQQSV